MTAYRTTPRLIAKQIKDFYSWYKNGGELSEVRLLSVDSIRDSSGDYHQSLVDDYADAISDGKAMPPIVVRRYPGQSFYVIRDGLHRYLASKENMLTHIPVLIEKNPKQKKKPRPR